MDQPAGGRSRPPLDARHAGRLVAAAEEALHEQGMYVIAALVESDNPASLALFRKAGYVEIDSGIHYLTKRDSADT